MAPLSESVACWRLDDAALATLFAEGCHCIKTYFLFINCYSFIYLFVHISIYLSDYIYVCLSVYLSVYSFIYLVILSWVLTYESFSLSIPRVTRSFISSSGRSLHIPFSWSSTPLSPSAPCQGSCWHLLSHIKK